MSAEGDKVRAAVVRARFAFQLVAVAAAVGTLRAMAPPKGDGDAVARVGQGFGKAAGPVDQVALDMSKAAAHDLPEVWIGKTANQAGTVVTALSEDVAKAAEVFSSAAKILATLAEAFDDARKNYAYAQPPLVNAGLACDDGDLGRALDQLTAAATLLAAAYDGAHDAATTAAAQLTALANEAHAHSMKTAALTASDRLVLAEAAAEGGAHDENLILSDSDAERAAQRLNAMSESDRQRLDQLLAQAKSPQERAYIMKVLAAGRSYDEVATFAGLIHGHGDSPRWLREHLTPIVHDPQTSAAGVNYYGAEWTQGEYPTCVASSTVMARALVDPSYALMLTTGNRPDDPASTTKEAFQQRLRNEQATLYDHGRSDAGNPLDKFSNVFHDGMRGGQGEYIADEQIGAITGQDYSRHDLGDADARRSILPAIENAVDQGLPVPVQVTDGKLILPDGHQMLIIGHDGDRLEIYNPWGTVTWVDKDKFINGGMDQYEGVPPIVDGVLLPGKR